MVSSLDRSVPESPLYPPDKPVIEYEVAAPKIFLQCIKLDGGCELSVVNSIVGNVPFAEQRDDERLCRTQRENL